MITLSRDPIKIIIIKYGREKERERDDPDPMGTTGVAARGRGTAADKCKVNAQSANTL